MKQAISMMVVLAAAWAAFGETYERGKVYAPIEILGDAAVTIDGNGAIIDGGNAARCATLGPNVTLRNFTFRNGRSAVGGGVWGGRLVGCTIRNCTASEYGAAIANCAASGTEISGCKRALSGAGTAAMHGGIVADSVLDGVTITGCRVELGAVAPGFGGIAANTALTDCRVTDNTLVVAGDHYGLLFYGGSLVDSAVMDNSVNSAAENVSAYMKVTPVDCLLDDVDDPKPVPERFDGSVANSYVAYLADGSMLVVSTTKQTTRGVALTAKLTVGKKTYSYSGGKVVDGTVTALPVCKTAGLPQFERLELTLNEVAGSFGGEAVGGFRLTQENFDAEFISWWQTSVSRVGVAFSATLGVSELCGPVKYSASRLPSGLKVNGATGEVSGVPTQAKEFLTRVTATSTVSSKLKAYTDFPTEVEALDDWAIGTFNGGGEGCQVKITVSKAGKISGQLLTGGVKWTLAAKSFADYADGVYFATLDCKNKKTVLPCEITLTEDGLVGACDVGGAFVLGRNCWKEYPWNQVGKGFAKAAALELPPIGEGFDSNDVITLKFSANGTANARGKFVKSYDRRGKPSYFSVSCSTVLCPLEDPDWSGAFSGTVHVYYPPKANTPLADGYVETVAVRWTGSRFELAGRAVR